MLSLSLFQTHQVLPEGSFIPKAL